MFPSHFLTCRRLGRHGSKGDKGDRGRPADDTSVPQAPMVGFSATLDQNLPRSGEYRVVRFNVVLTNHAAAYEPSTGKFTAPLNGSARPDPTDSKPNPTRPDPTTPRTSRPPASLRLLSTGQLDPTGADETNSTHGQVHGAHHRVNPTRPDSNQTQRNPWVVRPRASSRRPSTGRTWLGLVASRTTARTSCCTRTLIFGNT